MKIQIKSSFNVFCVVYAHDSIHATILIGAVSLSDKFCAELDPRVVQDLFDCEAHAPIFLHHKGE